MMQASDLIPASSETSELSQTGMRKGEHDRDIESVVSFHAELPVDLKASMTAFIERYPNWDQYRLVQAALAGFLVQNGVVSRSITRLYIGKMFACDSLA